MTAVSKNVYFDVLDNIVDKYINTVHRTTKMKPTDVTSDPYAEHNENSNVIKSYQLNKLKFKVGDHVRISKYKNTFAKGYSQTWSGEVFVVSKIKNTVTWTYMTSDLNGEKIAGRFYEMDFQKTSQEKFRIEKVIKRKRDKLYVKWKGYNNPLNSQINKKDLQ